MLQYFCCRFRVAAVVLYICLSESGVCVVGLILWCSWLAVDIGEYFICACVSIVFVLKREIEF